MADNWGNVIKPAWCVPLCVLVALHRREATCRIASQTPSQAIEGAQRLAVTLKPNWES